MTFANKLFSTSMFGEKNQQLTKYHACRELPDISLGHTCKQSVQAQIRRRKMWHLISLHCLLTEYFFHIWIKVKNTAQHENGLVQLIRVGNSIWIKWVNLCFLKKVSADIVYILLSLSLWWMGTHHYIGMHGKPYLEILIPINIT